MQPGSSIFLATEGVGTTQILALLAAIGGLTIVMLSTRRRVGNAQRTAGPAVRDQFVRMTNTTRAARDVEDVMAELDSLSRQIHGRIDTKLARLEKLIRDADRRITVLQGLHDAETQKRVPSVEVTLEQAEPGENATHNRTTHDRHAEVAFRLADDGLPIVDIAQRLGRTPGEIELMLALRRTRQEATSGSPGYAAAQNHVAR